MKKATPKKRGPKEDRLKIEGDWETAVGDALKKKRPEDGWPEPKNKQERNDDET